MQATINYNLSAAGQKAALAAGQGGQVGRTAEIEISADDLDLFIISGSGALSADLRTGATTESWSNSWKSFEFDHILTDAEAIEFLHQRVADRAAHVARVEAEKAEKAAAEQAAAEARRTAGIGILDAIVAANASDYRVYVSNDYKGPGVGVKTEPERTRFGSDDPEVGHLVTRVLEIMAREVKEKADAAALEAARAERKRSIPSGPLIPKAEILPDGKIKVAIPTSTQGEGWAKHVASINPSANNGMAFEGVWVNHGAEYTFDAGDVVVVGSKWYEGSRKSGEWKKSRTLYVATPSGLLSLKENTPAVAQAILDKTPQERVIEAINYKIAVCDDRITRLADCGGPEYDEFRTLIEERTAAWIGLKSDMLKALEAASAEPTATTIEEAAAAIVSAGYRALAAKNHPDRGGSVETMQLINQARTVLVELLKLAHAEVTA